MRQLFVNKELNQLRIDRLSSSKRELDINKLDRAMYKTLLSSLKNISFGSDIGYTIRLVLIGVGFRVEEVTENILRLKIGFSHLVTIPIPQTISVFSTKKNQLVLQSVDLAHLSKFASTVQSVKLPEVYKGKGILFVNQSLVLKEGKKK